MNMLIPQPSRSLRLMTLLYVLIALPPRVASTACIGLIALPKFT
jgi:hypothetical protein